jgi:bifunctional non-homologous end joining protein LigD
MLASGGPLPTNEERWAFEPKWDGFRALVHVGRAARVWSRRGSDLTDRFPEVEGIAGAVPADTVLDGELVVFGADGRPDFDGIRRRGLLGRRGPPATFVAFDVLRLGGRDAVASRYAVRRRMLADLDLAGDGWVTTPSYVGDGDALLEATKARGLEGVVAKRLDSLYKPGVRTRLWLKVKNYRIGRFLVGGVVFTGERATVLVGVPALDGELHYAGAVEVFSRVQLAEILELLRARPGSPFRGWSPGALFVEPEVAVEIRYLSLEPSGLRHATFLGLSPVG